MLTAFGVSARHRLTEVMHAERDGIPSGGEGYEGGCDLGESTPIPRGGVLYGGGIRGEIRAHGPQGTGKTYHDNSCEHPLVLGEWQPVGELHHHDPTQDCVEEEAAVEKVISKSQRNSNVCHLRGTVSLKGRLTRA